MHSENSRTANTKRNFLVGTFSKILLLGAAFIVRTLFIRILGVEYTGINSLFANILNILNLAELGMGSVLIYELYKPLKDNNKNAVIALVFLFKKIYGVVIIVVTGIGLLLVPFLKYIVNSPIDDHRIFIYYILYLLDSIASYFVVYRTTVIEADQKRYITNLVDIFSKFAMYVVQSVYLIICRDFTGYLIIQVLFTVVKNVVLHIIATRMYPYLRQKQKSDYKVNIKEIAKNVKATFVSKIASVVLNQTDSIIISMLFGTASVGYYSNYYMLIAYINSIYYIITTSLEASVGNLNAEEDFSKSYDIYRKTSFAISVFNSICVAGFICVVQDFITIWIGKAYVQGALLIVALMFSFYLQQSMCIASLFRQTFGLFAEVQNAYLAMASLNIVFSIILGKTMGVAGVAFATGLSRFVTVFWYEGKIVYKKFRVSFHKYIRQQIQSAALTILVSILSFVVCTNISLTGIFAILIKGTVAVTISLIVCWTVYRKSDEWKWSIVLLKNRLKR